VSVDEFFVKRFHRVIAVSEQLRDLMLRAGVRRDRLVLLHNAIVLDNYRRTGRRGLVAELTGRPVQAPLIASIGRISHEKGQVDLVEALAIVVARGFVVSAVFAGDGPARAAVAERVRALGLEDSVHMPGYVSQPQRILEEADLMVLPSYTEGLPNAALEALAMDVPVLATRVGGTPEVLTDGQTGRLVEPGSPRALAEGIIDFLSDRPRWKAMAARGHEMVGARFDFVTRTRRLEAIYDELAIQGATGELNRS
jgi:glycosyltransferase involved in cell wall biosynthesis